MTTGGRRRLAVALFLGAALLAATAPARDRPPPPVLDVPPNGQVALTIGGRPVTAHAGPGMPSRMYLSQRQAVALFGPDAARFPDEKPSLFSIGRGTGARIGPVRVKSKGDQVTLRSAAGDTRIGVSWFATDAYPLGEALAGPWALPDPIIRFHLHPPVAGEVTTSYPLASRYVWWIATTPREIGGHIVAFAFAPHFPRTVASAAAGAAIAGELGGRFAGPPERVGISHGVSRPARTMALARPLAFGPVSIDRLLVRTSDYGSTADVPDPSEVDAGESGEVVVKGRRRSRPSYVVYLGADLLGRCSSILYDKPGKTVSLTCAG